MENEQNTIIEFVKLMIQKMDNLDNKFDSMIQVQTKNSAVLEEHERRSTANEKHVEILEVRQSKLEKKADRLHGFFFYSGAILAVLGGLSALFHDSVSTFLELFKK